MDVRTLEARYVRRCSDSNVIPNASVISAFFKAEINKTRGERCNLEIVLDNIYEVDHEPLLAVVTDIEASEIETVDVVNRVSLGLDGRAALSLMRGMKNKLRVVDIQDISFGKEFCRELSSGGLACEVLNMRSSHFRKLSMTGKFMRIHTLNLDFSTSLTSFHKDCFTCMPKLKVLSLCETRITNLWTTAAALSKLPSLVELRFQRRLYYDDIDSYLASSSGSPDDLEGPYPEGVSVNMSLIVDGESITQAVRNNLSIVNNAIQNHDLERETEASSDDSEVDFSSRRQEYGFMHELTNALSMWSGRADVPDEVDRGTLLNQSAEESTSAPSSSSTSITKFIQCCASPICYEKHYRDYMIACLPHLKVLDELPIRNSDRENASMTFSQYFECLPYHRKAKQSVVSILHDREIEANSNRASSHKHKKTYPSGKCRHRYTRSFCAAKVGSSAWPSLQPLSFPSPGQEGLNFRPRQFEYHPSDSSLMVFGTLDGEVIVINHESCKIVNCISSNGEMSSVLGLCWLKKYPSLLIAGSDNGSLKLFDIRQASITAGMYSGAGSVTFGDFDHLTSVHVNSADDLLLASGYSKNVALYDINSGKRLQVFTDMHQEHINVVKFANHSPSIFATSSFDRDIKLWDLRQKPVEPCYTVTSSKGNVMVCFSPDDHYLLASAVDNEVKQFLVADGRLHMDFGIAPTRSSQNYTRSYYMNGRDHIISGSCDENVVRVCCAQTGKRLRDVSLEGKGSGSSMFVQSLRGDPHREFNMSVLAAYMRPSSKSEIVKVNMMASSDDIKEYSSNEGIPLSNSMGG